ncbi:MAG TPA: DNA-binding protein, partial [Saprospiraceae bacterium]|nr:DNA-binding protein [Saprospiraceae bacterium]
RTWLFLAFIVLLSNACTSIKNGYSQMKIHALRLTPGQDLRRELEAFTRKEHLQAGFIITCVGSLQQAVIRPANQPDALTRVEKFEIVSLTGTLSPDGPHLHIALSDSLGNTFGGHLLEGNLIYTTAEIVIGEAEQFRFSRETDPVTTYKELKISPRQ